MNISTAEAVNTRINWATLKKIIESDIATAEHVKAHCAGSEWIITRQDAKIETLRQLQQSMATLEKAGQPTGPEPDDAAAQRIAETFTDAADEYDRIEAEDTP